MLKYLASLALLLSGCAMVASEGTAPDRDGQAAYNADNIGFYSLPRALVTLEIAAAGTVLSAAIMPPVYAADPAHMYRLSYRQSPFSSDTVEAVFENKSTLLKSLHIKAEDKTGDIIVSAVKSAVGILEAGDITKAAESVIIARITFDPVDDLGRSQAVAEANAFLRNYLLARVATMQDRVKLVGPWCGDTSDTVKECSDPEWPIKLSVVRQPTGNPAFSGVTGDLAPPVDCSIGICYRPALPVTFKMTFGSLSMDERTIEIPNGAPIVRMGVGRAAFVTKIKEIDFDNGMITKVKVEKPSEALEVAKLPLTIAKEILSTAGEMIQFKFDVVSKEEALATKEAALIQAKKALAEKQYGTESGAISPNRRAVVVSVTNGFPIPVQSGKSGRPTQNPSPGQGPGSNEL